MTTGVSPAELLLGRQPRSRLDLLKPHLADKVEACQKKQQENYDKTARERSFREGDRVYSKHFGQGQKWLPGTIAEITGSVSFLVKLTSGQLVRRHQDHIRHRKNDLGEEEERVIEVDTSPAEPCGNGILDPPENPNGDLEMGEPVSTPTTEETGSPVVVESTTPVEMPATPTPQKTAQTPVRKSYPSRQ